MGNLTSPRRSDGGPDAAPPGYVKAATLRRALARGLAAWQAAPREAPRFLSPALLEASLRYLQAGYRLPDAQLALIFRSALCHETGVITALHHQNRAEVVALAVVEALTVPYKPLSLATLWRLQGVKTGLGDWEGPAAEELLALMPTIPLGLRGHVAAARHQLETGLPILEQIVYPVYPAADSADGLTESDGNGLALESAGWIWNRRLAVILLAIVAVSIALSATYFQLPAREGQLVAAGGGTFLVGDRTDAENIREVFVDAFQMMVHEVTNSEYRACVEAGACAMPVRPGSTLRPNSFLESSYAQHPVVQVRWRDAVAYCGWRGMRLPTAEEWEVAASYSPVTNRQFAYPWGDIFEPRNANHAATGVGDSQPVGAYHPHGNTPSGVRDLAGNVAEWTASPAGTGSALQIVKGGSFQDGQNQLTVFAEHYQHPDAAAAWLGFRCAR